MQLRALVLLLLVASVNGQTLIVPPLFANRDATAPPDPFPGTHLDARQQILVGASGLTGLQIGTSRITSLAFRRDGSSQSQLTAGRARLVVRVSSLARSPGSASMLFADNHGATVQTVFDGEVAFPPSPRLAQRDEPDWSATHSFTIPFQSAAIYGGGSLCIEIEGRALQATR